MLLNIKPTRKVPPFMKSQKLYIPDLIETKCCGLPLDCGKGKTLIMLEVIYQLFKRKKINNVLIIAPLAVIRSTWREEAEHWGYDFIFHTLHGKDKHRILPAHIYLLNSEALSRGKITIPCASMLIIDESSQFRNPTSNRTKQLFKFSSYFNRRYIMTGSPVPKGYENLWSQIYILDNGHRLGRNITYYRNTYFRLGDRDSRNYELMPGCREVVDGKIKDIFYHYEEPKEDSILYNEIEVNFSKEELTTYKHLKSKGGATIRGREISTDNVGSQYALLRQLSGGAFYYNEDEIGEVVINSNAKICKLKELFYELQGKNLVIAYNFNHELARICQAFNKEVKIAVIKGGLKEADFKDIKLRWNTQKIDILVVQPQAFAYGINIQKGGHHICWFSPPNDLDLYYQLNKRLDRTGQTETVTVHHLISKGTLDRKIFKLLKEKNDLQELLKRELYREKKEKKEC